MDTTYKPRFNIHLADGQIAPTIKRSFLIKMYVSNHDIKKGYLKLPDGTTWDLTLEPAVKAAMVENGTAECIVSFQLHEHGTYCVARYFNRNKPITYREPPAIDYSRRSYG